MASYAAWVRFSWKEPFLWKRFALGFTLAALPAIACFTRGWGVAGLVVFALGAWPFPPRVSVSSRGVVCRWLCVEQTVPLLHITHARLERDPRRGALLRSTVLTLGRHARPSVLIFAPLSILERLEHELRGQATLTGAHLS